MPVNRLQRKIEDLRQQPEHVRLRVASLLTLVGGGIMAVLWLTVLLPLQLKFTRGENPSEFPEEALLRQAAENPPVLSTTNQPLIPGHVGGIQDPAVSPNPLFDVVRPPTTTLPLTTTAPDPSPTPTPSPVASTIPALPESVSY